MKECNCGRPNASGGMTAFGTKPTYRDDLLFVCFWGKADVGCEPAPMVLAASDPKRTSGGSKSRSAAVSCGTEVCYPFGGKHGRHRASETA